LSFDVADEIPEMLIGDPYRLRQVLINLIGNSIKFTECGEIAVGVNVENRTGNKAKLHFLVRDTGMGIPPDKQQSIFEAFGQADSSTTRKYGGTGLGLTISARIVQMMKGRIWVESSSGVGSTFHFTAEFLVGQGKPLGPDLDATVLAGLRTLVVDDNATNLKILDRMVRSWLMLPVLVDGGSKALEQLEIACDEGNPFKVVLIDGHMPGMDGFELAQHIKANPRLADATVMMLTSGGQRGDLVKCRELGIVAYLVKPIRKSELLETILQALGRRAPGKGRIIVETSRPAEDSSRLSILLVEDNRVNQIFAVRLLEKEGHAVTVASNGREAVTKYESGDFDLILMDIQMPEMDGFEATAAIRAKEKESGRCIPIIAMTAHAMKGDRERCIDAGMDGYISKPIKKAELLEEIARHCRIDLATAAQCSAAAKVT
jgi:CheY-like chemotaxis protein